MHICKSLSRFKQATIPVLLASAAIFAAEPAFALCSTQGLELMRSLNGNWQGKGAISVSGRPERIACRVNYTSEGPSRIRQYITCAGSDYKIEAVSRVVCEGNLVEGEFEEKINRGTGTVRGSISGNHLSIEAIGNTFQGKFNVNFLGEGKHSVSITQYNPLEGREMPVASIQLTR